MRIRSVFCLSALVSAVIVSAQSSNSTTQFQVTPGVKLDTRQIFPQIDHTRRVRLRSPENPGRSIFDRVKGPIPPASEPNSIFVGGIGNYATQLQRAAYFRGPEDPSSVPPDPCASVGPSHVVFMVNTRIAFYDKATGSEQFNQDLDTFFNGQRQTSFLFDPKVVYDHIAQRWIVMCLEQDDPSQNSGILIGVSDDNNPNGTWNRYRINAVVNYSGTPTWQDYVSLGYNKDGIFMAGNSFAFGGGVPGCAFFVVRKAEALTGAALTVTVIKDEVFETWTPQAVENFDPALNKSYFANAHFGGTTQWQIHRIDNVTTVPTKTTTNVTVPTYASPTFQARSTNGQTLDSMDGRCYNAVFRSNKIVAIHNNNNGGLIKARWYQFNVNTTTNAVTLGQSGDISIAGQDCHMGSISINANDDIAVGFTRSSPSITADIMVASRKSTDPAGTMGIPLLLESSAGNNYTQNRWGDYSSVSVDPSDNLSFWIGHMNVRADNFWRTGFFKLAVGPVGFAFTTNKTVVAGQNSVLGTITLDGLQPTNTVFTTFDNSSLVATPATVTVLANTLTRNFQITVTAITSTVNTTISARLGAVTHTQPLTLAPLIPTALSFTPIEVTGGQSTSCRVVINGVAGPGGRDIAILDNSANSNVPALVTVPAGATSVTFPITTTTVTSLKFVTVTARVSAGEKTGTFRIIP